MGIFYYLLNKEICTQKVPVKNLRQAIVTDDIIGTL